jgi:hypothetical protein
MIRRRNRRTAGAAVAAPARLDGRTQAAISFRGRRLAHDDDDAIVVAPAQDGEI